MNSLLEKLMAKKKNQAPLDENYKNAKMSMLQALRHEMSGMMGQDLKNDHLKKVEVAASNKEDLADGLDKAKDLLGDKDDASDDDSSADDASDKDASDKDDDEMSLDDDSSADESSDEGSASDDAEKMIADMIGKDVDKGDLSSDKIDMLIQLLEKKKMGLGKGM